MMINDEIQTGKVRMTLRAKLSSRRGSTTYVEYFIISAAMVAAVMWLYDDSGPNGEGQWRGALDGFKDAYVTQRNKILGQ